MSITPSEGDYRFFDFTVLVRDLDPQAHMANHVYVAYLSEARARYIFHLAEAARWMIPSVVADVQCAYRSPLLPREDFRVGVRVGRIGRTSVAFEYEIRTTDRVIANARSVEVLVDAGTRRPRVIPEALRSLLAPPAAARGAEP